MEKECWFTEARFGLFLHWGLYAIPARGEWTYANDLWKEGEYEAQIEVFNPVDYDPYEWVRAAKAAGMKYVVFTTRHHDGFCMFDSHYSEYKITNTPYGKDVTRMLVEAIRTEGLKVGFYHSLPDWKHPGYADRESPEFIQHGKLHVPTTQQHREYQNLLYNHIKQLMSEYGKIDLLFLDYTSRYKAEEDYFDRERLLNMIYHYQPEILVNDRLSFYKDNVRDFDYYTPEVCVLNHPQKVKGKEVRWETCATMNEHWGYCDKDDKYKSWETLVAGLLGCVSQNGNLLLNIGPDAKGRLPQKAMDRLSKLGEWYRMNGEAVVGCGKSVYIPPFGCCYTQKGDVVYCCFLIPPMGDIVLPQLKGRIQRMTLLRTGEIVAEINEWGFELLNSDEQRIRIQGIRVGDVIKIELKPEV